MKTLAEAPPERQYFQLDADWEFYEHLLEKLGDRHVFVTYRDGTIEVMSPSGKHERYGRLIGILVSLFAEELNIPIQGGGSTTFKRKKKKSGLEPDECFWVANEARVRGKMNIDLSVDPPPDLAIEIEISSRIGVREKIYADLGIPELWRHDGERLRISTLARGRYRPRARSLAFPMLPPTLIDRALKLAHTKDQTTVLREFRAWVRREIVRKERPARRRKR